MESDITQIIEAAKRTSHRDSHSADKVLCGHAIRMAEALQRIEERYEGARTAGANDMYNIARIALAAVEKDYNHD